MFRHFGGLALRGIDLLGKQTLCQLSYSRSGDDLILVERGEPLKR